MVIDISPEAQPLLLPGSLLGWPELATNRALLPARPGVYAWYFDEIPPSVPVGDCVRCHGSTLLYVGIAPKEPPRNGRPASKATLRSRICQHYRRNAEGSTLRLTLGCLLADTLGFELRRVGSGNRMTFGASGEKTLSGWMADHARVCWIESAVPWTLEHVLVAVKALRDRSDPLRGAPSAAFLRGRGPSPENPGELRERRRQSFRQAERHRAFRPTR